MIKGGVKKVSNLTVRENEHGTLIITLPRATAVRMNIKPGDKVSVEKDES